MHQQLAVGIGHGIGQLQEQGQALIDRAPLRRAVDRLALHQLHHEVGPAIGGQAGIEQACDVGVIQARQGALLLCKTRQQCGRIHAASQDLDGDLALVGAVGTLRPQHLAHATLAKRAGDGPGAQALSRQRKRLGAGWIGWPDVRAQIAHGDRQGLVVRRGIEMYQQRLDLAAHRRIGRHRRQEAGALLRGQRQRLLEKQFHLRPVGPQGGWCAQCRPPLRVVAARGGVAHAAPISRPCRATPRLASARLFGPGQNAADTVPR